MGERSVANRVLLLNTLAFAVCFAVWTMYGVLIAYLVDHHLLAIDKAQMGWLIGAPILTGSILRLPVGILTDRFGGKPVFVGVMLFAAASVALVSMASSFTEFLVCGLLFGASGASFAVGVAYTSVYYPSSSQGTVLGIFGMGVVGSALTTLLAPTALNALTWGGAHIEGWRQLPLVYAGALTAVAVAFMLFAVNKKREGAAGSTLRAKLAPLKIVRVWRFGAYYFLVFGGFVALSQWLVPYYLNVYGMPLATAGLIASAFSLPSALTRAVGGWVADRFGARPTMYWVLSLCAVFFALLVAPRMDITSPGEGVVADRPGTVEAVTSQSITVDGQSYALTAPVQREAASSSLQEGNLILPRLDVWQEPIVQVGDQVKRRQLIARGTTHVYFQANVLVFSAIVLLAGVCMGIGMAAVFRHIPDYFPNDVGVVGGLVGVIGGLGGFFCPILFGTMLKATGLWTSCWMFLSVVSVLCLVWMHLVVLKMAAERDALSPKQA